MADISKIALPSGNVYDIKDEVARQAIAGGISFQIVWTATEYAATTAPSTAKLSTIPEGVVVYYNNGAASATGTLEAVATTKGIFYLIYSKTQSGTLDMFDEYATINMGTDPETYRWEKIGDTLIDLSNVVTEVTYTPHTTSVVTGYGSPTTDTVIGSNATFKVTQPTISVTPSTTYLGASASGANVAWDSKDSVTAVTGVSATKTNVKATASGANTAWNSKDAKTAVTGVSATKKKLTTTTITGVSGSTTPSVIQGRTSQTTATGAGTASTANTDWLKNISVSNEILTIGAATMNTQTTYSANAPGTITVPTAASSATTVATGAVSETSATSNVGATIAVDAAASGTASVIGASSTFTVTQPTIALATGATAGTGVISVATDAAASGTDTVVGTNSTFTVTQPTIALGANTSTATGRVQVATGISSANATGGNVAWNSKDQVTALTGLGTASKATVLDNTTTVVVTKGN